MTAGETRGKDERARGEKKCLLSAEEGESRRSEECAEREERGGATALCRDGDVARQGPDREAARVDLRGEARADQAREGGEEGGEEDLRGVSCRARSLVRCGREEKEGRTIGRVVNWYVPPSSSVERGGEAPALAAEVVGDAEDDSAGGVVAVCDERRVRKGPSTIRRREGTY